MPRRVVNEKLGAPGVLRSKFRAGRPLLALLALLALGASAALGCVKKGNQVEPCQRSDGSGCIIDSVHVLGNEVVAAADLEGKIATVATKQLLGGILEGIPIFAVEYERLDPFVFQRDLARIERYYRARGHYEAHVRAGRVIEAPGNKVKIEIVVDEGAPVRIRAVDVAWKGSHARPPERVARRVERAADWLEVSAVFDEDRFEETKKKLLRALTERGFAYAKVEGAAKVELAAHEAFVTFTIEPGPPCVFGAISIEGQGTLPTTPLLAALQLAPGTPYSSADIDSAEAALGAYGLFASIDADPKLAPPAEPQNPVIPVVFHVQVAPLRVVKLGGGAEIGALVQTHLLAGWEHRNFLGGLRRFSVNASPAVTFYPLTFNTLFDGKPVSPLPEFKLGAGLVQPGLLLPFDARTQGLVSAAFSVYRLPTAEATESKSVVGYIEVAGSTGLERPFWDEHINLGLYLNVRYDRPFLYPTMETGQLPSAYTAVVIPYVSSTAALDFRSSEAKRIDPINPHRGVYWLNELQVAFGSARDVRVRSEVRAYAPLAKQVTLAVRLVGGFLVPFQDSYGDAVRAGTGAADDPSVCRDIQLLQFRGFFSGGASSNRGYPYNAVGPRQTACNVGVQGAAIAGATGGFYLWESSAELRLPIYGDLSSVLFADASDVSLQAPRLCAPHLSTGLGLRYNTAVGPLRADVGYRVPGAQSFGDGTSCPASAVEEATQKPLVPGLPIAISVAIGQAF